MKKNNICAIIVTFNPDVKRVYELAIGLKKQNCDFIIVDNSTERHVFWSKIESSSYIWLKANKGIAEAQNVGIAECLKRDYRYIIFFDQDSKIDEHFISLLNAPMELYKYRICAPVFFDEKKGFQYAIIDIKENGSRIKHFVSDKSTVFTTSTAISSGTMVSADVFNQVGVMDSTLFIDYVDTEWCLRCFSHGIKIHIIANARMTHSIGDKSFNLLGFCIPVHNATRRYYRVRNAIHLFRYHHVPKLLAIREFFFSLVHTFILILTQEEKRGYIYSFFNAVSDGVRNVKGENPRRHKK